MPFLSLRRPQDFLDSIGLSAPHRLHGASRRLQDSSAFAAALGSSDFSYTGQFSYSFSYSFSYRIFLEQLCFSINLSISSLL